MRLRVMVLVGICVILGWAAAAAAVGPRVILALGNTSFIDAQAILKATGAEVTQVPGNTPLKDVAVLVLADVPFGSLPQAVQGGLMLGERKYAYRLIPPRKPLSVQWV